MTFWNDVGTLRSFQRGLPIVSSKFHAGDIRTQNCHWVHRFSTPNFCWVENPKHFRAVCYRRLALPCGKVLLSSVVWSAKSDEKRSVFGGRVKLTVLFSAVSGPRFMNLRDDVSEPRSFQCSFPTVSIVFLAGDISRQSCHWNERKEVYLYSAMLLSISKSSDMDHTVLPPNYTMSAFPS